MSCSRIIKNDLSYILEDFLTTFLRIFFLGLKRKTNDNIKINDCSQCYWILLPRYSANIYPFLGQNVAKMIGNCEPGKRSVAEASEKSCIS